MPNFSKSAQDIPYHDESLYDPPESLEQRLHGLEKTVAEVWITFDDMVIRLKALEDDT